MLIYKKLLLTTGAMPNDVDNEDAEMLLEVLGAKEKKEVAFIDEV